jgi:hypothetical protein
MANEDRSKRERARRVYSTALINKLIDDRNQGYDIDFDPFFNRDTELRASNIPFKMTDDEMEEYQKCYDNPEYFIDKYCKFMTDKGMSTVQLRDYQTKVIDLVTAESYDEDLDDAVPTNRNIIWLASRQVGKCVSPSVSISCKKNESVENVNADLLQTYLCYKKKINIIDRIKNVLYKIYKLL